VKDGPPPERAAPGRIARLALTFWTEAAGPSGYPRDPEPLIDFALPVAVQDLPGLNVAVLRAWAARHGFPAVEAGPDRALRGCLLARRGQAFLLLDPRDPPDERRVTVAHELGHFLLEVWWPRRAVQRALGPAALAVLDGERAPTLTERLDAALAGLRLNALSPVSYLAAIRAPDIAFMHDRDDLVIPVGESRRLRAALAGRGGVRYTEFGLFQHADPTKRRLSPPRLLWELGKFFRAVYPMFRRAAGPAGTAAPTAPATHARWGRARAR
jgi:hypothetical protein